MKTYIVTPALLICSILIAQSAPYNWIGGGDNNFNTPGNWDPEGPPSGTDLAIFNPTGTTTVNFTSPVGTTGIQVQGSADGETQPSVLFNLNSNTYTVSGGTSERLGVFTASGSNRTLLIQNGELNIAISASVIWGNSNVNDITPEVTIRVQEGATLRHSTNGGAGIGRTQAAGQSAKTAMYVEDGGKLIAEARFTVGGNGGDGIRNGELHITGPTSSFEAKTSDRSVILLGDGLGTGTLNVRDGGLVDSTRAIGVGYATNSTGLLSVSGVNVDNSDPEEPVFTASRILGNQLYIGGGRARDDGNNQPRAGGEGVAEFLDGGHGQFTTLLAYYNSDIDTKGTLRIDDAFVTVSGTATFEAGSVTELGLRSVEQDVLMFASNLVLDSTLQLLIDGSFSAALHDSIHLIEYTSLTGTFAGLGEGDTFSVDGHTFSIHYAMGDGENIIGLTVIPEPGAIAMILGAICLGVCAARRKLS